MNRLPAFSSPFGVLTRWWLGGSKLAEEDASLEAKHKFIKEERKRKVKRQPQAAAAAADVNVRQVLLHYLIGMSFTFDLGRPISVTVVFVTHLLWTANQSSSYYINLLLFLPWWLTAVVHAAGQRILWCWMLSLMHLLWWKRLLNSDGTTFMGHIWSAQQQCYQVDRKFFFKSQKSIRLLLYHKSFLLLICSFAYV